MKKYWYIGCRAQQAATTSTGSVRHQNVTRWNTTVYNDANAAAAACVSFLTKHPGTAFFIQGFDRKLNIIDGESHGFIEEAQ